jgi:hypothetical protein
MSTDLLQTPLHALHAELGARMVPFAGYAMPVQYPAGILAEHRWCRDSAALFDVSHMGQLQLRGEDAAAALESLLPQAIIGLDLGKQRYAFFTNPQGGMLDDLMVTCRADHLFLVVNAGRKAEDIQHLVTHIVAKTIVNGFEMVEINKRHGKASVLTFGTGQFPVQAVIEQSAIGQIRQRIVLRHMPQFFCHRFGKAQSTVPSAHHKPGQQGQQQAQDNS